MPAPYPEPVPPGPVTNVCWVLREDPELAEAVEPVHRAQAIETLLAREVRLPTGSWQKRPVALEGGLGFLVLEGVMLHRVGIEGRYGAELVGEGDVLRPLIGEEGSTLALEVQWVILSATRVAILDERFARLLGAFPEVAAHLFARSVSRARQLTVNMAIVHQARVDHRLHLLFWHLASRWGRVRSDGVLVPLRLTHVVLSDLVAARRPTVTSALSKLNRDGLVSPVDEGWLLKGAPPGEDSSAAPPGAA